MSVRRLKPSLSMRRIEAEVGCEADRGGQRRAEADELKSVRIVGPEESVGRIEAEESVRRIESQRSQRNVRQSGAEWRV
jgi:hypothetical protein